MVTDSINLSLWTVRDFLALNFKGTLQKVAEMGYKGVEFAWYYAGLPAEQVKDILAEFGLQVVSAHVLFNDLTNRLDEIMDYQLGIGNRNIICPAAPLKSMEDFQAAGDTFNNIGEKCRKMDLGFGYHNHSHEFQSFNGQIGYDILLEGTDPGLVFFEMDTGWVQAGGYDPVSYIEKYAGRFPLAHIRDYLEGKNERGAALSADVGKGLMNFYKVLPALKQSGTRSLIIEQGGGDGDSLQFAGRSLQNLRNILGELRI